MFYREMIWFPKVLDLLTLPKVAVSPQFGIDLFFDHKNLQTKLVSALRGSGLVTKSDFGQEMIAGKKCLLPK